MTHANPRNWLQLDESLPHQLRRATQAWTINWHHRVPDLTSPQFAVLLVLRDHGTMDQTALGTLTAVDRTTITQLLDRLEARELVTKEADPANRRRRIITLTEAGRRHLETAVAEATRLHERLQSMFGEEELQRLVDMLRTLGDMPLEAADES